MRKLRLQNLWDSSSTIGVILAALLFAASLTPSLVPRTALTQGVLSGCALAAGYGIGRLVQWIWNYMELPKPTGDRIRLAQMGAAGVCILIGLVCLFRSTEWQNGIRRLMQLGPVPRVHPWVVCLVAIATFVVLCVLAWLFAMTLRVVSTKTRAHVSAKVANVIGAIVAIVLFWSITNGILLRIGIHLLDASFQEYDALIEPDIERPGSASKTGSDASLLKWDELGRTGRSFIASAPTRAQLSEFSGRDALEPIRVYAGLGSAPTEEARAKLALEELERVGGFARSALVVVTPTGTGWIDPDAMASVEYLFNGDIASVGLQYSYLASWLSLLVEPEYGADAARALFAEIYAHWTRLPKDRRPKLYLYGLSLGAMNSEQSADLFEILGDPVDGALWVGPPYPSRHWRYFTASRNLGSPAWLPRFRDGSFVRFMNQDGRTASRAAWGPMRIIYLQYASDAITFFDNRSIYREPDWMKPPRAPDVSPQMRWYPIVTYLQLIVDMALATTTPIGYGHVYSVENYVDAWLELTQTEGWPPEKVARLKRWLAKDRLR